MNLITFDLNDGVYYIIGVWEAPYCLKIWYENDWKYYCSIQHNRWRQAELLCTILGTLIYRADIDYSTSANQPNRILLLFLLAFKTWICQQCSEMNDLNSWLFDYIISELVE